MEHQTTWRRKTSIRQRGDNTLFSQEPTYVGLGIKQRPEGTYLRAEDEFYGGPWKYRLQLNAHKWDGLEVP